MDRRRIGGGMVTAAGVLAPWVADMMGLQIDSAPGTVLLIMCAIAAITGILMIFWPSKRRVEGLPQSTESTFLKARGGGKIRVEDSYSSADVFLDLDDVQSTSTKRVRHVPRAPRSADDDGRP